MPVDFYQQPDPASGGQDYARQLAAMMMKPQRPQGGGQDQFVVQPGAASVIAQLAGGALAGAGRGAQMDANKAATALNAGVPTVGQVPDMRSRMGQFFGGGG